MFGLLIALVLFALVVRAVVPLSALAAVAAASAVVAVTPASSVRTDCAVAARFVRDTARSGRGGDEGRPGDGVVPAVAGLPDLRRLPGVRAWDQAPNRSVLFGRETVWRFSPSQSLRQRRTVSRPLGPGSMMNPPSRHRMLPACSTVPR